MIKVMFICHGNICRSPMAEFVLKDMVKKRGLTEQFFISSSATSREEIGNPVHYGTKNKLAAHGIDTSGKYAVQLKKSDYADYDYLIAMDSLNLRNIGRIIPDDPENKICRCWISAAEEISPTHGTPETSTIPMTISSGDARRCLSIFCRPEKQAANKNDFSAKDLQ